MTTATRILVTGAGGFIGHHLVRFLKQRGHWVRGADLKLPEFEPTDADQFLVTDLRRWDNALAATEQVEQVYHLAADMGGMGFISANHAQILRNNSLIDTHVLDAARENAVGRVFYSSSACVYPEHLQETTHLEAGLKEEDAYPANPQDAYGWQKLITERLCRHFATDFGVQTRVARFHNVYGPLGTWQGGREKAPAALARKVAIAKLTGGSEIDIWGDGEQTRSFCYVDDCVEGIYRLMQSDHEDPINLGSEEMVSINQLVDLLAHVSGARVTKHHIDGPQGVRGRNSDNNRMRKVLSWEPPTSLQSGLERLYPWVEQQVTNSLALGREASSRRATP